MKAKRQIESVVHSVLTPDGNWGHVRRNASKTDCSRTALAYSLASCTTCGTLACARKTGEAHSGDFLSHGGWRGAGAGLVTQPLS